MQSSIGAEFKLGHSLLADQLPNIVRSSIQQSSQDEGKRPPQTSNGVHPATTPSDGSGQTDIPSEGADAEPVKGAEPDRLGRRFMRDAPTLLGIERRPDGMIDWTATRRGERPLARSSSQCDLSEVVSGDRFFIPAWGRFGGRFDGDLAFRQPSNRSHQLRTPKVDCVEYVAAYDECSLSEASVQYTPSSRAVDDDDEERAAPQAPSTQQIEPALGTEWERGIVLRTHYLNKDASGCDFQLEVYTVEGRRYIKAKKRGMEEGISSHRVKFALIEGEEYVVIRSSSSLCPYFSMNLRHGRLLTLRSIALLGHVEYGRNEELKKHLLWCDDIGFMHVKPEEIVKWDQRQGANKEKKTLFQGLRIAKLHVECPHYQSPAIVMSGRGWSIQGIFEQGEEEEVLSVNSWPQLVQRVDDLFVDRIEANHIILRSVAFPSRLIVCESDNFAVKATEMKIKLSAVMAPQRERADEDRWLCLVAAPIQRLDVLSSGRIFNYRPQDVLKRRREESQSLQQSQ